MSETRCMHNMRVTECVHCNGETFVEYRSKMNHFRDKETDELKHVKCVQKITHYRKQIDKIEEKTMKLSKLTGIKCT